MKRTARSILLLLTLAGNFSPAQASDLLRQDLHSLAEKITAFLKAEKAAAVAVGQFSGPPSLLASSGPGIKKTLIEEFESLGILVDRNAGLVVKGDYGLSFNEKGPSEGFIFGRVLRAAGGQILFQFKQPISERGATEELVGGTAQWEPNPSSASTTPPAPPAAGEKEFSAVAKPPVISEAQLAPVPGSPYWMEILVGGNPRPPKFRDGYSFVQLGGGETYQVRLWNRSEFDAGVRLAVDGLSMFAFNQEPTELKYVIVPKGQSITVPGWFFTFNQSKEFAVTTYPESAAAMLGAPEDECGTITATFSAAWRPQDKAGAPIDERKNLKGGLATGLGESLDAAYKKDEYEIGKIRAAITMRYDR